MNEYKNGSESLNVPADEAAVADGPAWFAGRAAPLTICMVWFD